MKNYIVMILVPIILTFAMGCEVHNYPDGHTVVTPAGANVSNPVVVVDDPYVEPAPVVIVADPCASVPLHMQLPPWDHEADYCFYDSYGYQCEWYVGYGCYESYTFYHDECSWYYSYDYCL